jgi:hypothetical protein
VGPFYLYKNPAQPMQTQTMWNRPAAYAYWLLVHVEEKEKENSILIHVQSSYCFAKLEFS